MKSKKLSRNKKIGYIVIGVSLFAILFLILGKASYEKRTNEELTSKERELLLKMNRDLNEFKNKEPEDISKDSVFYPVHKSEITQKLLEKALRKTALENNAKSFIKAEDRYGINAIFLLAIANHESAFGTSRIAQEKNNLFGFNAVDSDPYNGASGFKDLNQGILEVAKKIKKLYLDDDGKYFNGYSAFGMNKNYSSDPDWAAKVNEHMVMIVEKILDFYQIDY
ncbi:MAG: glucosaminidase domain-containing protein [Finegoldia sp.]|nr:glucosaminidase domain-containing protein [Finegoldia sp.]